VALAACACTIPKALPSSAIALTRKSGWVQIIASLMVGSTFDTIPTTPSGEITGLKRLTPALEPAVKVIVVTSRTPRP
jgi:hypothetical protein